MPPPQYLPTSPTSPTATQQPPPTLQLAQILSDLVTLRVCDPAAALNLVSARPSPSAATNTSASEATTSQAAEADGDKDLRRAKDLVGLHYTVKVAHERGAFGEDLRRARELVRGVLGE